MKTTKYLCVDGVGCYGEGNTLHESWENYKNNAGEPYETLSFFRGAKVETELKIKEVEEIVSKRN